jgi:hypothetical protein
MKSEIFSLMENTRLDMAPEPEALPRRLASIDPGRRPEPPEPPARGKAWVVLIAFALFVASYFVIRRFIG